MESVIGEKEKNLLKANKLLKTALSKYNADFVFLPEVWTVGWDCQSFYECAENIDTAESVKMLKAIAKKYNTNILGGSIIEKKSNGSYANTCPVINRKGELVCTYEKISKILLPSIRLSKI